VRLKLFCTKIFSLRFDGRRASVLKRGALPSVLVCGTTEPAMLQIPPLKSYSSLVVNQLDNSANKLLDGTGNLLSAGRNCQGQSQPIKLFYDISEAQFGRCDFEIRIVHEVRELRGSLVEKRLRAEEDADGSDPF
jgi:hypothetical protein